MKSEIFPFTRTRQGDDEYSVKMETGRQKYFQEQDKVTKNTKNILLPETERQKCAAIS